MKNLAVLLAETAEKKIEVSSLPACIYIETVQGCPYSCAMCQWHFSAHKEIEKSLLDKISPYFENLEVLAIHGAGEPLLGDIQYYVDQAIRHNFILHMNTTGFFLSKEIADILSKVRLSIRFSIHAATSNTYRKIMGNQFETVLDNIKYLIKKNNENHNNSDFWFSFIVMKENIDEIPDFLKLTHEVGIRHVRFMELEPNPQSIRGVRMPNRDFTFNYFEQNNSRIVKKFITLMPTYKQLASELNIQIESGSMDSTKNKSHRIQKLTNAIVKQISPRMVFFPLKKRQGMCLAPWLGQLIITQNGGVRLCCPCNFSLGNLNESTLEELWKGNNIKGIRESFKQGRFPRMCGYCRGIDFSEYPKNSLLGGFSLH